MLAKRIAKKLIPTPKPVIKTPSEADIIFSKYVHGEVINKIATDHEKDVQEVLNIINDKEGKR